jgi:glucose/arabinose dehydrogenase
MLFCDPGKSEIPENDKVEVVTANLEVPWAMAFLEDGVIVFTERTGTVKMLSGDSVYEVGRLEVASRGEAGLLGIAADSEYASNNYVYIYYTYWKDRDMINRISRFVLKDTLKDETILLDNSPGAIYHDGGRVAFGPDGKLYAGTGDARKPSRAQDTNSLSGKILRMNKDGSIPRDNPFGNYVYALGLRNPQGLAWRDGMLYATDHGPTRHDEVNKIEKGGNYGWPRTCEEYPALRCYTEFTLAPADIVAWQNYLFVTGLRGNQLRRINLENGEDKPMLKDFGRLRPAAIHGKYLYFATSNRDGRGRPAPNDDRILRIRLDFLAGAEK